MRELVAITEDNWRDALAITVQPDRLPFVASIEPVALILLAKCAVNPDGQEWHPLLLLADGVPVGIVGVGVRGDVAWVHHVLISTEFQGKGHGRALMTLVAAWVPPTVTRLGLNVVPANEVGWALYESLGFVTVGVTLDDQNITMAYLSDVLA
jgi:RimJ/RimL family protein N-acetyltransferase